MTKPDSDPLIKKLEELRDLCIKNGLPGLNLSKTKKEPS